MKKLPLEPRWRTTLIKDTEMNSIWQNYKEDYEIENGLEKAEIEDYMAMNESKFKRCEYCNGPLLGHIEPKCPKIKYDETEVKRFEKYLGKLREFEKNALEEVGRNSSKKLLSVKIVGIDSEKNVIWKSM